MTLLARLFHEKRGQAKILRHALSAQPMLKPTYAPMHQAGNQGRRARVGELKQHSSKVGPRAAWRDYPTRLGVDTP